jgi:hypothetical protein
MPAITVDEFTAGAAWWQAGPWPADFHNAFYRRLSPAGFDGRFTDTWWDGIRRELVRWQAIRPQRPADVTARLTASRTDLIGCWAGLQPIIAGRDITDVTWEQVRPLPDLAATLKPTRRPRPVFTSKFCHFLAPAVFPVADQAAVGHGTSRYTTYFHLVQDTWAQTPGPVRDELHARMRQLIAAAGQPPAPGYPFVNKIVEVALIGRRHT